MTKARVTIPATTCNLGPGLDCMALALELYNVIELAELDYGLHLDVEGDFDPQAMQDSARLALAAMVTVFHKAGYLPSGLHVHLECHIPPGSSLGGSTACLLGGAVAANVLLSSPFTRGELLQLVLRIDSRAHAVLAAQVGGLVISTGQTSDLSFASLTIRPLTVVVVLPPAAIDGASITLPQQVSLGDAITDIGSAALVAHALGTGDFDLLACAMKDRLHEAARSKAIPGYQDMIDAARTSGAAAVTISGEGPALVAFAKKEHSQIAQAMAGAYGRATGGNLRTWVIPADTQGVSISQMGMTALDRPVPASEHPVVFPLHKLQPPTSGASVPRTLIPPSQLASVPAPEG